VEGGFGPPKPFADRSLAFTYGCNIIHLFIRKEVNKISTPCVMYFTKCLAIFGESFHGRTSRNEMINGMIIQRVIADSAEINLTIDGLKIDAPDNLGYVEARKWVLEEIKSLGYHIVEKTR
jgi:hypothetical protein